MSTFQSKGIIHVIILVYCYFLLFLVKTICDMILYILVQLINIQYNTIRTYGLGVKTDNFEQDKVYIQRNCLSRV